MSWTHVKSAIAIVALTAGVISGSAIAQGVPPGFENKPLPIYPGKPTDCYVLLKNQWPYVQGGDYPVCGAIVSNLNKFCEEDPQYDHRKIHPTASALSEPAWQALDVNQNMDLVKQTATANSLPQYREAQWERVSSQVMEAASSGRLRLYQATISVGLDTGKQTVYRLDNAGREGIYVLWGHNQPLLMIAAAGERTPSPLFNLRGQLFADLWSFRGGWFLVRFDPNERRFHAGEIVRAGPGGPLVATPRCTFQHVNDRPGA